MSGMEVAQLHELDADSVCIGKMRRRRHDLRIHFLSLNIPIEECQGADTARNTSNFVINRLRGRFGNTHVDKFKRVSIEFSRLEAEFSTGTSGVVDWLNFMYFD